MRLTNRLNLPAAIVDAVRNDGYSKGLAKYSVTELLRPPRIGYLSRLHYEDIEEDASERIYSLYGQIIHGILERASGGDGNTEFRLYGDINGISFSGQIDQYEQGIVRDFKFITANKFKSGCPKEYVEQLNAYAALCRIDGRPVDKLELVGLLRDWSKMEAVRDPEYPQNQVIKLSFPPWDHERAMAFLTERINLHEKARIEMPDPCSQDERWERDPKWAVMMKGRQRAVKLHDSEQEAVNHSKNMPASFVEHRPSVPIRCFYYCNVNKWCDFYQRRQDAIQGKEVGTL